MMQPYNLICSSNVILCELFVFALLYMVLWRTDGKMQKNIIWSNIKVSLVWRCSRNDTEGTVSAMIK